MMRIEIPTGFTFSDIRAGLPSGSLTAFNTWLKAAGVIPSNGSGDLVEGSSNPLILKLDDFDLGGASFDRGSSMSDMAVCSGISNLDHFPTSYVNLICGIGGNVYGLPVFFEFDNASDLDADVPSSFPNRTWVDDSDEDNPVTVAHTWNTWEPTHAPVEYGGKWYKSSETSQEAIPASKWINESLAYKTVSEYREIVASNSGV